MSHEQNSQPEMGLMTMEVPSEIMNMLRRVQEDKQLLQERAFILNTMAAWPRGDTDESEHRWRSLNYQTAVTILAMAGNVINQAVEGGLDSRNCNPTMFLTLACMLSAYEVHAFTGSEE